MFHNCDLPNTVQRNKRVVQSNVSFQEKTLINLQDFFTIWINHYLTKKYFRSIRAVYDEKRRHLRGPHWYIIHPLSKFAFVRDVSFLLTWLFAIYKDTFICGYMADTTMAEKATFRWLAFCTDPILFVYCLIRFFSGYIDSKTNEIILNPWTIAKRYAKTYFLFDFIGCMPAYSTYTAIFHNADQNIYLLCIIHWIPLMKFLRIITVISKLRQFWTKTSDNITVLVTVMLVVLTTYFVHLHSCLMYYFIMASISPLSLSKAEFDELEVWRKYITTLYLTFTIFAGTSTTIRFKTRFGYIWGSYLYITGYFFKLVTLSWLLSVMTTCATTDYTYELSMQNVHYYADRQVLPNRLRFRMFMYYKNLFGVKLFDEEDIFNSLSPDIQKSLFQRRCKIILSNVPLLNNLTVSAAERIVLQSTTEYYLDGDVISARGSYLDGIYVILHGSVAVIFCDGNEFYKHYSDGDTVGEPVYLTDHHILRVSYVATEFTQTLLIPLKLLDELVTEFPKFYERIAYNAELRLKYIVTYENFEEKELEEKTFFIEKKKTRNAKK